MFNSTPIDYWLAAYIFLICISGIIYYWNFGREKNQKKRVDAKESVKANSSVYIRKCIYVYPEPKQKNGAKGWDEKLKAYR
ncbi:hypothetical protein MKZ21_30795 [Paenibacillus sp. FSL P2-0536]|uniref:hypothetical protein n=1 Tax=Paenibacillus sp. FSL P2-0536 TaxID=2921629 RepID=UPI0030FC9FA7